MASRAHWKGYLKLSLVSCPIALYPAISAAERISFRQVNRQTGNRLRQQLVDTVTGEVVQPHDKSRGYEVGERQLILVKDEELEAARQEARQKPYSAPTAVSLRRLEEPRPSREPVGPRAKVKEPQPREDVPDVPEPPPSPPRPLNNRTIEIERFVAREQIDPRYHDPPYYIAPREEIGQEAFAVIREAMRQKEMAGMARVVLAKRERPIAILPLGNGLCGMTLRYAHEVRSEQEYFAGIPDLTLPAELLEIAEQILASKTADFDAAYLEDRYRTALVSMLKDKQAELPKKAGKAEAPSPQNVVDLMDALKRSLEGGLPSTSRKPPARRAGTRSKGTSKSSPRRKT